MDTTLLQMLMAASVLVFVVPKKMKWHLSFALQLSVAIFTSWLVFPVLFGNQESLNIPFVELWGSLIYLKVDALTAFFIWVVNFTAITGGIYAFGYLKPYLPKKRSAEFGLHYFSFLWLHISMLLVCMLQDGLGFLIAWELMSVSSFFLVIFEFEKESTVKIGIKYLVQMHIALVLLMTGFIVTSVDGSFGFESLSLYFSEHAPFPVFILFFLGFGIKAGFMPLHTWLPYAHPAAPSHVSGVMSGVMIKMGIYGILRVVMSIHTDLLTVGIFILVVSLISGILGVMYAIVQHDLKKLLAFHSIENIGIIGIGIGIGLIGVALDVPVLAALGFTGGILHVLNHSLFKSLLFYSAGSVYQQTHSRDIESLGGLIKKMPKTALLFLLGALAISGLPPFNGFVSEFLIYMGLFDGLQLAGFSTDLIILTTVVGLSLIGGLAIFCFTKVFSIVFLGTARSKCVEPAHEVEGSMILPKVLIGILIVTIGFFPVYFVGVAGKVASLYMSFENPLAFSTAPLSGISMASALFVGIAILLWLVRRIQQKKTTVIHGPTWGCGYTGADPAVHQYTATSYADQYQDLASPLLDRHKDYDPIQKEEIFPKPRKFESHTSDLMEEKLINPLVQKVLDVSKRIAVFQTGKIQHYVLYAVLFMAFIFCLTIFKWI